MKKKIIWTQDFTSMIDAAMEIKEIKDKSVESHERYISIKSNDIVDQICQYIYETIKPVLETDIHKSSKFRDSAAIYTSNFKLDFGIWQEFEGKYFATLRTSHYGEKYTIAFFNKDGYKISIDRKFCLTNLVQDWKKLKDSMNRMIPYAIKEYNEYNAKEVDRIAKEEKIINNFRL